MEKEVSDMGSLRFKWQRLYRLFSFFHLLER